MALIIRVSEIPPYDGDYEFDDRALTTRELRWIKQIAGYLPTKLEEGLDGGDMDVYVALLVIAMQRAGKISREEVLDVADRLADVPMDGARIQFIGDMEDDAGPPESSPSTLGQPESSPRSSNGSRTSSGTPSDGDSVSPEPTPLPTGTTR